MDEILAAEHIVKSFKNKSTICFEEENTNWAKTFTSIHLNPRAAILETNVGGAVERLTEDAIINLFIQK